MKGEPKVWKDGLCKEITFIVTKACQLACKYCYQVGKNDKERMSFDTAKSAIDYILSLESNDLFAYDAVVFSFIGGEPLLEIDLIDQICDYLKMQMQRKKHHWLESYRISITTNGLNYHTPKVQRFIKKNADHISITITLDGTPQKHDMNRIWKSREADGKYRGSYSDVVKNIPLWLSQFSDAATKVTISSADLPFICESVLHLFKLGIHNVNINCVFEDVWKSGDDIIFENQLRMLADTMITQKLYEENYCSFFNRAIGHPLDYQIDNNWCGAGMMLSIDANGFFYPCTRFAKYSLREKPPLIIGNILDGINPDLLRPFFNLSRSVQSSKECFECEVASGCAWCQGENYDSSDTQTIFQRSTAICKMHKARVRANNYFWSKIDNVNFERQIADRYSHVDNRCRLDKTANVIDTIIVLLSSRSIPFCGSDNKHGEEEFLSISSLQAVIEKAKDNNWKLVFVYPQHALPDLYAAVINSVTHKKIVSISGSVKGDAFVLQEWNYIEKLDDYYPFIILRTSLSDFYQNIEKIRAILNRTDRLEIVFTDEDSFSKKDELCYKKALDYLVLLVYDFWAKQKSVEVNLITYRLHLTEMDNCEAGNRTLTLAPNGKFYICPDFYFSDEEDSCGSLKDGIAISNPQLYKLSHSLLCAKCGAFHCKRCVFLNRKKTKEVNTPSLAQCKKTEMELEATKSLYYLLLPRKKDHKD